MKEKKDGNDFTDAMIVSGGRYSAELAKKRWNSMGSRI